MLSRKENLVFVKRRSLSVFPIWVKTHVHFSLVLGVIGNFLIIVGLFGNLSSTLLYSTLLLFLIYFCLNLFIGDWCRSLKEWKKIDKIDLFQGFLIFLIFIFIFLTMIQGLLPPTSRDALIHHLALPLLYIKEGRIFDVPFLEQAYNPMLGDVFYFFPLLLSEKWPHADSIANWIHFSFGLGVAHLLYCFLRDLYGRTLGLLGCLVFISLPLTNQLGREAYVDLTVTYFLCLSWILLFHWVKYFQSENKTDSKLILNRSYLSGLFLSGCVAGLAMATKYNGFLLVGFTFLLLLLVFFRWEISSKGLFISALIFILGSLCMLLPSLGKNIIWTGNPIYPYFRSWLGWAGMPPFALPEIPPLYHRYFLYGENIWQIIALPIRIFFFGEEGNPKLFDGKLSPLFLVLFPFAFRLRKEKRDLFYSILFLTVFYFLYVAFFRILRMRYLMPIVPLFTVWAFLSFSFIEKMKARKILISITLMFVFLNLYYHLNQFSQSKVIPYLSGKIERSEYLKGQLYEYSLLQWMNEHLSLHDKVLFVFLGHRGYYCEIPYIYDFHDPGRSWRRWLNDSQNMRELRKNIISDGISHVLMHRGLFDDSISNGFLIDKGKQRILKSFLYTFTKELKVEGNLQLLKIL